MIVGGTLSKDRITFIIDHKYYPVVIRGLFAGRSDSFTIPPFDEKVRAVTDGDTITFSKPSAKEFLYEEINGIIKLVCSFSKITSEEARALAISARELLKARVTYFLPNFYHPYLEIGFYYNWVRIDFHSYKFREISASVKKEFIKALGDNFKVFSNNIDDISIYNWDNNCIFLSRSYFKIIGQILKTMGFLKDVHQKDFSQKLVDYAVEVYAFNEASDTYKRIRGLLVHRASDDRNQAIQYFLELLSALSKNGRIYELRVDQQQFLQRMKDKPDKIREFCDAPEIALAIGNVTHKLAEEIEIANKIRPVGSDPDVAEAQITDKKTEKPKKNSKMRKLIGWQED